MLCVFYSRDFEEFLTFCRSLRDGNSIVIESVVNRKGPRIEPCRTPISKSIKITARIINFSSTFSVCEVTVHNFKGFVRETVCF